MRYAALVLAVLIAGCSANAKGTYSGTLQAESAQVGSTVGGRITAVLVNDGQRVKAGQVLVRFDDKDQQAALASALGQLAQANATLADLQAGPRPQDVDKAAAQAAQAQAAYEKARSTAPDTLAVARQAVHEAQAATALAKSDFDRAQQLYNNGAIPAQSLDEARAAYRQAQARFRSAQAQLSAAQSGAASTDVEAARQQYEAAAANLALVQAGTRPGQVAQAQAAVSTAQAQVSAARARLAEMVVRSPADGIVSGMDLRPGDLVQPGASVTSIDEQRDPYVRIFVAQPDLGRFAVGQSVRVKSDAFKDRTFTGSVEFIDQSAQFTPRDVQTAQDRANLVFGVKVRVHDPDRVLRGGTTVEISGP
ncbi:MAG TPA: HlyD family efflux transporter periplasmic adaptor subunit [Candidatus Tumulicola sp.]|nr:HlyD family efflux transporter periplasmic adaptor subunit [Candidatus Tumulicola sp.]